MWSLSNNKETKLINMNSLVLEKGLINEFYCIQAVAVALASWNRKVSIMSVTLLVHFICFFSRSLLVYSFERNEFGSILEGTKVNQEMTQEIISLQCSQKVELLETSFHLCFHLSLYLFLIHSFPLLSFTFPVFIPIWHLSLPYYLINLPLSNIHLSFSLLFSSFLSAYFLLTSWILLLSFPASLPLPTFWYRVFTFFFLPPSLTFYYLVLLHLYSFSPSFCFFSSSWIHSFLPLTSTYPTLSHVPLKSFLMQERSLQLQLV